MVYLVLIWQITRAMLTHSNSHSETTFQPKTFTYKLDQKLEADAYSRGDQMVCKHSISKRPWWRVLPHAACPRKNTCFRFEATTHCQVLNVHCAVILFWAWSFSGFSISFAGLSRLKWFTSDMNLCKSPCSFLGGKSGWAVDER